LIKVWLREFSSQCFLPSFIFQGRQQRCFVAIWIQDIITLVLQSTTRENGAKCRRAWHAVQQLADDPRKYNSTMKFDDELPPDPGSILPGSPAGASVFLTLLELLGFLEVEEASAVRFLGGMGTGTNSQLEATRDAKRGNLCDQAKTFLEESMRGIFCREKPKKKRLHRVMYWLVQGDLQGKGIGPLAYKRPSNMHTTQAAERKRQGREVKAPQRCSARMGMNVRQRRLGVVRQEGGERPGREREGER
jgi:hypothetical protein